MVKMTKKYYIQGASVLARLKGRTAPRLLAVGEQVRRSDFEESVWEELLTKKRIREHTFEGVKQPSPSAKVNADTAKMRESVEESKLRGRSLEELNTMAVERGRDPKKIFEDTETAIIWLSSKIKAQ